MSKKKFYIIGLLVLLFLGSLTFIVLQALPENKAFKKKAAEPNQTAVFTITGPTTVQTGNNLPLVINLQASTTPGNHGIIGVKAVLSYTFTNSNPLLLTEENIVINFSSPWGFFKKTIEIVGNKVTVIVEAIYAQGTPDGDKSFALAPKPFATLNFRAQNQGSVVLRFDVNQSAVYAKEPPSPNILNPDLLQTFNVVVADTGGPTPTATTTPIITATPAPSVTPSLTPTLTPTPRPNPYCSTCGFYSQGPYSDTGSAAGSDLPAAWTQYVDFIPAFSGTVNGARIKINIWTAGVLSCKITDSTGTTDLTQETIRPLSLPTPPSSQVSQWPCLSFNPFSVVGGTTYRLYCRKSNSGDFRWIYDASTNIKTYSICMQEGTSPSTPTPTLTPTLPVSSPTPTITLTPSPTPTSTIPPNSCPLKSKGDADCNGEIKLADFFLWRREFLQYIVQTVPPTTVLRSDFNGDGRVNLSDFFIWRKGFLF